MPSQYARTINMVLQANKYKKPETSEEYIELRRNNLKIKPPPAPKGVHVEDIYLKGIHGENIKNQENSKGVILYVHGGGFTGGSAIGRRALCQYISSKFYYDIYTFDYRLAPENVWPAPLNDCLEAYTALLDKGIEPDNIIVMGESAGGNLALSLAILLKNKGLPQPKALCVFSPATTHAEVLPSHTENIATDYMLLSSVADCDCHVVFGEHAQDTDYLKDPLISPLYADYKDIAPIFISVSDTEVLFDDSLYLYEKLQSENHKTSIDVQHEVCHAFTIFTDMPEAKDSLQAAFRFVEVL